LKLPQKSPLQLLNSLGDGVLSISPSGKALFFQKTG